MAIERPSLAALLIHPSFAGNPISSATGFVAGRPDDDRLWVVTNWHVVTGRDPGTGQALNQQTGAVPDGLIIGHHLEGALGTWHFVNESIYDTVGDPLWFEHPSHGRKVDVVALPITKRSRCAFVGFNPWEVGTALPIGIGRPLSVIGFPFGQTAGGLLPVWLQAWVASEPDIDFNDLPLLLVDARTRQGQSGSPVIAFAPGGPVPMDDGSLAFLSGPVERFVGVYSGRINEQSDIGLVWKRSALVDILDAETRGSVP